LPEKLQILKQPAEGVFSLSSTNTVKIPYFENYNHKIINPMKLLLGRITSL
jgi:hypothetical protein